MGKIIDRIKTVLGKKPTSVMNEALIDEPKYDLDRLDQRARIKAYNYCAKQGISTKGKEFQQYRETFFAEYLKEEKEAYAQKREEEKRQEAERILKEKQDREYEQKKKSTTVQLPTKAKKEELKVETLLDVVRAIADSQELRWKSRTTTVSRVNTYTDGKMVNYWFLPDGHITPYGETELKSFGTFVHKNSYIAIKIQTSELGSTVEYDQINNIKRLQYHSIRLNNRTNLQDHIISLAGDETLYQYRDIHEFLEGLQLNQDQIHDTKTEIQEHEKEINRLKRSKNTATQRSQLTRRVNQLKDTLKILTLQREELGNITIYIRKQGEIRHTHIIDTIQTRIMSQNLYDGKTIIIDGGPGTGKTTTMIHRLNYLTETFAIKDDKKDKTNVYHLDDIQRKHLLKAIEDERDWMFFSPSAMLKKYLADAMVKEGLKNTSLKVWHWDEYSKHILETYYKLLETPKSKAPFKASRRKEVLFNNRSGVINELMSFFVMQLRQLKDGLPKIDLDDKAYGWSVIAREIKKRFDESGDHDLTRFINLFNSLQSVYAADCKSFIRENNLKIQELVEELLLQLETTLPVKAQLQGVLEIPVEESTDSEDETEKGNDEEAVDVVGKELKKWIKAYALSLVKLDTKLSVKHFLVTEILLPVLTEEHRDKILKIGNITLFEQYAKLTNGVSALILGAIPSMYKKFRSHLLQISFSGCDLQLLNQLNGTNGGKELHYQERSLLLGFINNTVKTIHNAGIKDVNHNFIAAYNEVSRPIIGVDEATDFCDLDIYAMQSLLIQDFNSMTLCGDMMQRLTPHGISSWSDLDGIVANPMVVEMKTSYRQSTRLLDLARKLYIDTIGLKPSYKAYMTSKKVPIPLAFVSESEFEKINWISKRIEEVYRAYGEMLPSIAIFVNDKGEIRRFIEVLCQRDFFIKNKIEVVDGTTDISNGVENYICVYPIDIVKGMEFDVVFFHNLEREYVDTALLKRYIYVGVSRAAFFLGITLSEWKDDLCKYFERNKDWFKI